MRMKHLRTYLLTTLLALLAAGQVAQATSFTDEFIFQGYRTNGAYAFKITHNESIVMNGQGPLSGTSISFDNRIVHADPFDVKINGTFLLEEGTSFSPVTATGELTITISIQSSALMRRTLNRARIRNGDSSSLSFSPQNNTLTFVYAGPITFDRIIIESSPLVTIDDFTSVLGRANTYQINSLNDLIKLGYLVNDNSDVCSGYTFLQTVDLDLNQIDYNPIGKDLKHPFKGTYDGQGHKVYRISISRTGNDGDRLGIFGFVQNGTIQNLVLEASTISGREMVGGIAGEMQEATIRNCLVLPNVTISGSGEFFGGIVGRSYSGSIIGCRSAASVDGTKAGGIVGHTTGSVQDCLYTGTSITGPLSRETGSIVGYNGSFDGFVSPASNCYYTSDGPIGIGRVTYNRDSDGARRARRVGLGNQVALVGDETEYNVSGITAIGSGNYALRFNNTIYSGATQELTFAYTGAISSGCYVDFRVSAGDIVDNVVTVPEEDINVEAVLRTNVAFPQDYITHWQAGDEHKGTQSKPFIITTPAGLSLLSSEVNGGRSFTDTYFKLGSNIDLKDVNGFEPIGSSDHPFRGFFLGDGKVISNLTVNKPDGSNVGLFGYCNGATIRNLTLRCASITGHDHVGVLVGNHNNGHFSDNTYQGSAINGDAFNIGTGVGDVNGISCDATTLFLPAGNTTLRAALIAAYSDPGSHTAHGGSAPDLGNFIVYEGTTRLYTVTCHTGVHAATPVVTFDSRSFFAPGSTVTLSYAYPVSAGQTLTYSYNDGSEHGINGNSFSMPEADVSVSTHLAMPPQTIPLKAGFNWVSISVDKDLYDVLTALNDVPSYNEGRIYFYNLNHYVYYTSAKWYGTMGAGWKRGAMYQINAPADAEITLEGEAVDLYSEYEIVQGVNSLGFPLREEMSVSEAFSGFAVQGDIVSSQTASAVYSGSRWRGSLTTLEPGQGYLYQSASQSKRTHVYPAILTQPGVGNTPEPTLYETHWPEFNYRDKQLQRPIVATVRMDGKPITSTDNWYAMEVAAFVGGECRGHAFMRYDASEFGTENPVVELPVYYYHDSANETVTFKLYDHAIDHEYDLCFPNTECKTGTAYVDAYAGGSKPVSLNFSTGLSGDGSENAPYVIYSAQGWDLFCNLIRNNDDMYFDHKTVKLASDITVTRMAGKENGKSFRGVFDGCGHTLTFNYIADSDYAAPFYCLGNGGVACIRDLRVKGTIYTNYKYAAGIAAKVEYNSIQNDPDNVTLARIEYCTSSIVIRSGYDGEGMHGGLVGEMNTSRHFYFLRCLFNGKLLTTSTTCSCGGFVGRKRGAGSLRASICLYAPAALNPGEIWVFPANSATYAVIEDECGATFKNWTFYTEEFNDGINNKDQGDYQVYTITHADGITASFPSNSQFFSTDVISYCPQGVTVTLETMDGFTLTGGYSVRAAGGNDISMDGNTFVMPDKNVIVTTALETVPVSLTGHLNEGFYWATFYSGVQRYTLPEGTAAYTMNNYKRLYRLGTDGRTIPAGVAVVIISDKQVIPLTPDSGTTEIAINGGDNILRGSDYTTWVDGSGKVNSHIPYVLGKVNNVFGFHRWFNETNDNPRLPAHKAYYFQ